MDPERQQRDVLYLKKAREYERCAAISRSHLQRIYTLHSLFNL